MSEVIKGATIVNSQGAISQGQVMPSLGGNSTNLPFSSQDLQQIKELADVVSSVFKTFTDMRKQMMPQQSDQADFTARAPQQAPQMIGTSDTPRTIEKIVEVPKKISKEKLKQLLKNLIIVEAQKLPDEIKEMKVSDFIGENFEKFTFRYGGVLPITSEIVLDKIVDQFVSVSGELYE